MSKRATDTHNKKSSGGTVISSGHRVAKGLRANGADMSVTLCRGHTGRIAGKISQSQTIYR